MSAYLILKHLHVTTALITVVLFAVRLLMDLVGRPGWRQTPLRWIPHANDTLLLTAAIGLVVVTPWMPFVHGWLTAKIILLIGYIVAGAFALKPTLSKPFRVVAAMLALVQVAGIFHLALFKPAFG
ncbi:SirB2 family protein [Marinobacter sp. M216]|uniref:SirB2 family protein n=1 Tax=Marinobacter albus TaxID=3030833 RepID=A0ABT7H9S7_9GAMM|nr:MULTISPECIES: SirB2 family protein [unclassified Marinobacter]MBW7471018.1 SirB2 family protein [Marinobacter sp. F4218]MDK9556702.1 SirB2 family protein [Marinobacter sp. M216]